MMRAEKLRGAGAPLLKQFPPSLHKYSSEGGEGDRFLNPYMGARLRVMFKTKLIVPGIPSAYSANSPNL
jgi:hypothetical protein